MSNNEKNNELDILRHSTSHIMAAAVKELYDNVKIAIGPSIENGFYYDFDLETPFTSDDLKKIEEKMKEIIKKGCAFERMEVSKKEAIELFGKDNQVYKIELLDEIQDETVSLYKTGNFIDLCRGPHIDNAKKIKGFKLLSVAGAYWRGSEKNKMLQRIYGTSFYTKDELDEYIKKLEEASKRDHRKLASQLNLFSLNDEIGPGLVIWHPKLAYVRKLVENFWTDIHIKKSYELIVTPHIAKIDLWKTSGHWDFYQENMYSPILIDEQEYILKPMNCPFHIIYYNSQKRSYKELPVRLAEMGTVYRYERSGVLHGLLRVRGFTQDDAHIFCTPDQLKNEMIECVKLAKYLMETFGFTDYQVNLSTRGEKYIGDISRWEEAEKTLSEALDEISIKYTVDPGEAVFYGPKIDIKIKDCLGRLWQGPTIQFDFNLPERFNVKYIANDGKEHYVYMVHRAMFGSFERFFGCLIEHYAGAFPLWLAPTQLMLIPVSEKHLNECEKIKNILENENIRVKIDSRNEKLNFKIRSSQVEKIPYMAIIGDREVEQSTVSLRSAKKGDLGNMPVKDALLKLMEEIKLKS